MFHHKDESWGKNSGRQHRESVRYAYAVTILNWHQEMGIQLVSHEREKIHLAYRETVYKFAEFDLHKRDAQEKLAREQLNGRFEWAYQHNVPEEKWYKLAHELEIDAPYPPTLGKAAEYLRASLEEKEEYEEETREEVRFRVYISTRYELLAKADAFYEFVSREEEIDIGGKNALLSCSLERTPFSDGVKGLQTVTLLNASALGLHHIEKSEKQDDLLEQIRSGALSIDAVMGEPKPLSFHHREGLEI